MVFTIYSFQNCSINIYGGGLVTKSCLILATPWTVSCQGSPIHGISQAGMPNGHISSPGNLPTQGFEPGSPAWQANSYQLSHQGSPINIYKHIKFSRCLSFSPLPSSTTENELLLFPKRQPSWMTLSPPEFSNLLLLQLSLYLDVLLLQHLLHENIIIFECQSSLLILPNHLLKLEKFY